jgi:6-pyruvoyltetrahydropterin/6-carboxytetrahydropterin synthase
LADIRIVTPDRAVLEPASAQRFAWLSRETTQLSAPELTAGLTYELAVDSFFGAAHAMRPGGARHTHSFRVQATFVNDRIDDHGMVVGFREMTDLLESEARRFANSFINDIPPFDHIQPTAENIAAYILRSVQYELRLRPEGSPRLVAVTLWENPTSYVKAVAA